MHMLRIILANALQVAHILAVVLLLMPFVAAPADWMKYIVVLCALIIGAWHTGAEECDLTALEHRLRGQKMPSKTADPSPFFQNILNTMLRPIHRTISPESAFNYNYLLFIVILLVSFGKLCILKGISVWPQSKLGVLYAALIVMLVMSNVLNNVTR